MSSTKDNIYQWAKDNKNAEFTKFIFTEKKDAETYFEDYIKETELEIYDIKNAIDINDMLEKHLNNNLKNIKKECVIAMLKSDMLQLENHVDIQEDITIPEFIYTL